MHSFTFISKEIKKAQDALGMWRGVRETSQRSISEVPKKKTFIFPKTITTFDIIVISSYICYFSTLGTRYRKYRHDLLNQRRHSIPLEKKQKTRGAR